MASLDYCCCLVHFLKNLRWHLHNCLPRPHLIVNFERFGDQVPLMIKTVMDTGLSKKILLPPALLSSRTFNLFSDVSDSKDIFHCDPYLGKPPTVKTIKKIPRGSREKAARKFAEALEDVISTNSAMSWSRLVHLPGRCLSVPKRTGRRWNLTALINRQISEERDPEPMERQSRAGFRNSSRISSLSAISKRVSCKLEEGDYKGAIRLASSRDTFAQHTPETLDALRSKHPPTHPASAIPSTPDNSTSLVITQENVLKAL